MKLQNFFKGKTMLTKKSNRQNGKRFLPTIPLTKGYYSKYIKTKNLKKLNRPNNPLLKGGGGIDHKRILNQGISIGRKIFKEMFNIINH